MIKKGLLSGLIFMLITGCIGCVPLSKYDELQARYASLQQDLSEKAATISELEAGCESLRQDLNERETALSELEDICPPKRFESEKELEDWLIAHPTPPESSDAVQWFRHAREVQNDAAEDGYIISAYLIGPDEDGQYQAYCEAVLQDHSLYMWDPETDEIYFWGDVRYL